MFEFLKKRDTGRPSLTDSQKDKEDSLLRGILWDLAAYLSLVVTAIASGSLTILAELPRAGLLFSIEIISLITLRRSHRGHFSAFEYGIGKIERIISIVIGIGLFFAAFVTLNATVERLHNPIVLPTPAMIMGVVVASFNLAINLFCTADFSRANSHESSLILESQVRSRLVKTFASAVVVVVLVVATWISDPVGAAYVDAFGALFVIGYMMITGYRLLTESLPDLLDRALPEEEQLLLMRVMTRYFGAFEHFGSIKSRRSGGRAFIDVDLEFEGDLPLAEVDERCKAIQRDITELIPSSFVSVVPHVVEGTASPK